MSRIVAYDVKQAVAGNDTSMPPMMMTVISIAANIKETSIARKRVMTVEKLQNAGLDVLLDDRNERPGVKFKDMDLLGIPVQIVVGSKNLPKVEFKRRDTGETLLLSPEEAAEKACETVKNALAELNDCSGIRL